MAPESALPSEVEVAIQGLDLLVKRFEEHPEPAVQVGVSELLQYVDTIHRAGMRRLNALLKVAGLQQRALDDPEVRLLFDLYDLGEGGEQARAQAVLEAARAQVEGYGGSLELLEADHRVVRVRLTAPAQGGPELAAALRARLEDLLRDALPGVTGSVEVVAPAPPPAPTAAAGNFVPLASLKLPTRPTLTWLPVLAAADVVEGAVRAVDVEGQAVLLANVEGEVFAYRNVCPGSPLPLEAGTVAEGALTCPWHGCRFSLRGGRRADGARAPGLGVVPVRVEQGEVRVGLARPAVPA